MPFNKKNCLFFSGNKTVYQLKIISNDCKNCTQDTPIKCALDTTLKNASRPLRNIAVSALNNAKPM